MSSAMDRGETRVTKQGSVQAIPLDRTALSDLKLSDCHRKIAEGILDLLDKRSGAGIAATITADPTIGHVIRAVSKQRECCPFTVYLYRPESAESGFGTIGVEAGLAAYFNVPEDLTPYPAPPETVADTLRGAIEAILDGALEEELYKAGDNVYRTVFRLSTEGGPISIDRRMLGRRLRGLFKNKSVQRAVYAPY